MGPPWQSAEVPMCSGGTAMSTLVAVPPGGDRLVELCREAQAAAEVLGCAVKPSPWLESLSAARPQSSDQFLRSPWTRPSSSGPGGLPSQGAALGALQVS